ncbi:MAG TPA: hypothetical protein VG713_14690 [Pirellulales bacterium]|nr:hypothetical protein [Pirellulales bacterium]
MSSASTNLAPATDLPLDYPGVSVASGTATAAGPDIKPPVLIPVTAPLTMSPNAVGTSQGFNISEPVYGYRMPPPPGGTGSYTTVMSINGPRSITLSGVGPPTVTGSLPDTPFDHAPNSIAVGGDNTGIVSDGIIMPGTYLDYKTVFLQRLADPTQPYNDTSNPYLTIDWMPIDLTVFNGQVTYQPPLNSNTKTSQTTSAAQVAESGAPMSTSSGNWTPPTGPGWTGKNTSQWTGWNTSPRNYLRHVATSITTSGSWMLALESRQRGFRTAEFIQSRSTTAPTNYPPFAPGLDPFTTTSSPPSSQINMEVGSWPPISIANSGQYHATEPVPEAPLWAAVSDHPRPRLIDGYTEGGTNLPSGFKHQVKGHSLGFINDTYGRTRNTPTSAVSRGSWINASSGTTSFGMAYSASGQILVDTNQFDDYVGAPQRPFPWLTWHNRPYANAMELLLVPSSAPGRFTTEFSYATPPENHDRYLKSSVDGSWLPVGDHNAAAFSYSGAQSVVALGGTNYSITGSLFTSSFDANLYSWSRGLFWGTVTPPPNSPASNILTAGNPPYSGMLPHLPWPLPNTQSYASALASSIPGVTATQLIASNLSTNSGRFPYGHLMNFFASSNYLAGNSHTVTNMGGLLGASSNLHRIFEFVEVPSRFSGTADFLTGQGALGINPVASQATATGPSSYVEAPQAAALAAMSPLVPFTAPFNTISRYRVPGKININTLVDHLGGYSQSGQIIGSEPDLWQGITNDFPEPFGSPQSSHSASLYAPVTTSGRIGQYYRDLVAARANWNPSFSSQIGGNIPRTLGDFMTLMQSNGATASTTGMFNPDVPSFYRPFRSFAGNLGVPVSSMVSGTIPGTTMSWALQASDSNVFRRLDHTNIGTDPIFGVNRDSNSWSHMYADPARDPYFRFQLLTKTGGFFTTRSNVYAIWVTVGFFEVQRIAGTPPGPGNADGYQLLREYGADTGAMKRYRGFAIIDRTIPVGFQRGQTFNVDKCFLVRRQL